MAKRSKKRVHPPRGGTAMKAKGHKVCTVWFSPGEMKTLNSAVESVGQPKAKLVRIAAILLAERILSGESWTGVVTPGQPPKKRGTKDSAGVRVGTNRGRSSP